MTRSGGWLEKSALKYSASRLSALALSGAITTGKFCTTMGKGDWRSSSWQNVFTYSLQGLKFCPFDWSTMIRFGLDAAVVSEAKRVTPITIRNFSVYRTFRYSISRSRLIAATIINRPQIIVVYMYNRRNGSSAILRGNHRFSAPSFCGSLHAEEHNPDGSDSQYQGAGERNGKYPIMSCHG